MKSLASLQTPPNLHIKRWLIVKYHANCNLCCRFHAKTALRSGELKISNHPVLDKMPKTDTFAWNQLIQTYLDSGDVENVMGIYEKMLMEGVRPDKHTLPRILAAVQLSNSLFLGRQVHGHAVKQGISCEDYVITALMKMYGQLEDANAVRLVFNACSEGKSTVSGTLLISMYLKENKPRLAVDLFYQLVILNSQIDAITIMTAAGACGVLRSLNDGKKVHQIAKTSGLDTHVLVCNTLLKMYLDCGSFENAVDVFNKMSVRDFISWTEMIGGYVKNGGFNEGLKLLKKMVSDGIQPDPPALASVLPACARMTAHKQGKEIHCYTVRNGVDMNVTVQNALLDMYIKSGYINSATNIFNKMTNRDAISWTIMIYGYSLHGKGADGVKLFREMQKKNHEIDGVACSSGINACIAANMYDEGKIIFSLTKRPEIRHYALLVLLLARTGHFEEANTFIKENHIGQHTEILRALLDGCRIHQEMERGKKIAEQLCRLEPLNAGNYILLSNWYASKGNWEEVHRLKEEIRKKGLVPKRAYSWMEFRNKIHVFVTGDVSHPKSEHIYSKLQSLVKELKKEGYPFNLDFSFHDVHEERECLPIWHSEMLAVSFGLISTQGTTIRVTKALRVCHHCHATMKALSRLVDREIILKDPKCFHHFKDGHCSCGDVW